MPSTELVWPCSWPSTQTLVHRGEIRLEPEDFRVTEVPVCQPIGKGEHVWLRVRKRLLNTDQIARALARFAGVSNREVSFAGLKDRNAVTEQWFSVRLPKDRPDWSGFVQEGAEILEVGDHDRKLRRGALRGNRFEITVRKLEGDLASLESRLREIKIAGVPNYFGPQRFGRDGGNLSAAERLFARELGKVSHTRRGLYLSAARSYLFNQVLARRIEDSTWDKLLQGEKVALDGSHSLFSLETLDDEMQARVDSLDVHPTGPMWGRGAMLPERDCAELEQQVLAPYSACREGLESFGLKQERRPLRMAVRGLDWVFGSDDSLRLTFELSAGSYATSVLRELIDQASSTV